MRPRVFTADARKTIGRRLRDRYDFADLTDRVRMPWRFQARHMAVDGNLSRR